MTQNSSGGDSSAVCTEGIDYGTTPARMVLAQDAAQPEIDRDSGGFDVEVEVAVGNWNGVLDPF